MHQSFLYLIVSTSILQNPIKGIEVITGVWDDDFEQDWNGNNGWKMYEWGGSSLGNPIILGNGDKEYHGPLSGNDVYNEFYRKFQCAADAKIWISYKFAFCETENSDHLYLYVLDSWTVKRDDNMQRGANANLSTYENPQTIWGNNLPGDVDAACDWTDEYEYKVVTNEYMGTRAALTTFTVKLETLTSATSEYVYLWDFQLHCDFTPPPTPYPSPAPSNAPSLAPTIAPSNAPSLAPSIAPTIAPSHSPTPPSNAPTLAPSLAPTIAPSVAPTSPPSLAPSNAPTIAPSVAPTSPPTLAPSTAPTSPPSLAPTTPPSASPTTCLDYGNYTEIDGEDIVLNAYDYINYVQLLAETSIQRSADVAALNNADISCDDANGCELHCDHVVSCLTATYHCNSPLGCNIYCGESTSCSNMVLYADKHPTTSITLVCGAINACRGVTAHISGVQAAEIHCVAELSCQDLNVTFSGISSQNNSNTSVSCYAHNACGGAYIYADGPYTRLNMYDYSEEVTFDNGYGFVPALDTVTCGTELKYIHYEKNTDFSIAELARAEYEAKLTACEGVTIQCADANDAKKQCAMSHLYTSIDDAHKSYSYAHCVWVLLADITQLECDGCWKAPTLAPTPAPTDNPTLAPSLAPSLAPTTPPSAAPSLSPSLNPTAAPTVAPSLAPTTPPTAAPSDAPSLAPTDAPSVAPTHAPTQPPTQAPTRFPTNDALRLYDSWTDIVYIFRNLTRENYDWILNNSASSAHSAVSYLEEVIESGYFHFEIGGPDYQLFSVRALAINQVDYKDSAAFEKGVLYNKTNWKGTPEMHMKSQIKYKSQFEHYLISTCSKNARWATELTYTFREYLNNTHLNFSVSNTSGLFRDYVKEDGNSQIPFIALSCFLGLCIMLGVLAKINNGRKWGPETRKCWVPVDNANWLAVIIYGLQIYDMFSDFSLTYEIFIAITNDAADDGDNIVTDDLDKVDTLQEYVLWGSGIMSLVFLVVPYILNIVYAAKLPNNKIIRTNATARTWFDQHQYVFIALVVISGGCYPSLSLISSNIFGIKLLNAGLSSFELAGLSDIRVITTVLTENGPQLFVQIGYSYATGGISQTTVLAFSTSIMSIIASILNFLINRDKKGAVHDIFYYFELKKSTGKELNDLSKPEKFHIKKRKGIKLALARKIVKLYGDIDVAHFEIGHVTIRKNNFVTRVCQHLHEQDLANEIKSTSSDPQKPFKNHCFELFAAHREEIATIMFGHYSALDPTEYELLYHREYPSEKLEDKVLHGKQKSANLRELIAMVSANPNEGGEDLSNQLIKIYRIKVKQGWELLFEQIKGYQELYPDRDRVPQHVINEWKSMLHGNGIPVAVIGDVLQVAHQSELFRERSYCDSDIETPDESMELFVDDKEYKEQQKKIKMQQAITKELKIWPDWFTYNEPSSSSENRGLQSPKKRTKANVKKKKKKNKRGKKKMHTQIELNTRYSLGGADGEGDDSDFETNFNAWAME